MSRLFTGRTKTLWPNNNVALLSVVRSSQVARVFHNIIIVAGLICIATTTVLAQQVETVKSEQSITCGSKSYQVRLIAAETLVNGKAAKALTIALTPSDASESKVFDVYWLNASTPLPTHRDNTSGGALGRRLITYGTGKTNKGVPVVESFFAESSCSSSDPQVIGIRRVIDTQSLLDKVGASPLTLKVIVEELNSQGVASMKVEQIQSASAANLEPFKNLTTEMAFARAIRQFLSILVPTDGRNNEPPARPTRDEEKQKLLLTISQLQQQVQQLETKKPSYVSAPLWLIIAFPLTSFLSVGGIAFFGMAAYHLIRKRNSNGSSGTHPPLPSEENRPPLTLISPPAQKPSSEPGTNEATKVVEAISGILKPLVLNIDELKKSVDSLDTRLKEHAVTQGFWEHLYENDDVDEQKEKILNDVRESLELFHLVRARCGTDGTQINRTGEHLKSFLDQLDEIRKTYFSTQLNGKVPLNEIIHQLRARLDQDSNVVEEFSSIQKTVRKFIGKDINTSEAVTQLIKEQSEAREKLEQYHSGKNFSTIIDAVVHNYDEVTRQVQQALPDQHTTGQENGIKDLVTSLAAQYINLKPKADRALEFETENGQLKEQLDSAKSEVKAGKQLVDEIAAELNFNSERLNETEHPITATLNRLKAERTSSVYLQLRMGLSSALIALDKAIKASEEHKDVIEALYLEKIKEGIEVLLAEMEDCSGEQLWHRALSEGFRQKWLHYLIRAEVLLRTYFADQREFSFLSKAISLACSSILVALHEFQVEVIEVRLLDERPREMDMEPVYPGIRNLRTVQEKVRSKIVNIQMKELVVDVTSFPYFVKGVQENRGRAAIANPSAWVQH